MSRNEELSELATLASELLASENETRFSLGEILFTGRALCSAGGKLDRPSWEAFRAECGFGPGARTYCIDLIATYEAFPAIESRHAELSWTAHREAARAADKLDLSPSEVLDDHPTVASIKSAVTGAEREPTKRVPLRLLVASAMTIERLVDEVSDAEISAAARPIYLELMGHCGR